MTAGGPSKKLAKSPARAWLLGDFVNKYGGRNGGEDRVRMLRPFSDAKEAAIAIGGKSNCRINRKSRF